MNRESTTIILPENSTLLLTTQNRSTKQSRRKSTCSCGHSKTQQSFLELVPHKESSISSSASPWSCLDERRRIQDDEFSWRTGRDTSLRNFVVQPKIPAENRCSSPPTFATHDRRDLGNPQNIHYKIMRSINHFTNNETSWPHILMYSPLKMAIFF